MSKRKSPGAVAALGASEIDELRPRVDPETTSRRNFSQAPTHAPLVGSRHLLLAVRAKQPFQVARRPCATVLNALQNAWDACQRQKKTRPAFLLSIGQRRRNGQDVTNGPR
jgi:hypothetical protein